MAQWRRMDWTSEERAWADRARPASAVVGGVLGRLRLEQRQAETEIVKVWNRLLDPNVATHAQPVGLKNGTLFVQVDNSVWLSEIVRYRQREILQRLQASFGTQVIRRLSIRLG
jgi:predicted nucleic acid-binding Zn ribbon protein